MFVPDVVKFFNEVGILLLASLPVPDKHTFSKQALTTNDFPNFVLTWIYIIYSTEYVYD